MKRAIQSLFAALAMVAMMPVFASCEKENLQPADYATLTLTATMEQPTDPTDTKTSLGEKVGGNTIVNWTSGDNIVVYSSTRFNKFRRVSYLSTTSTGTTATFALDSGDNVNLAPLKALFPLELYDGKGGVVNGFGFNLPAVQNYVAGGIESAIAPMMAYTTSGTNLEFKNICGIVKLSLKGAGVKVSQVVLRSGTDILSYNFHCIYGIYWRLPINICATA